LRSTFNDAAAALTNVLANALGRPLRTLPVIALVAAAALASGGCTNDPYPDEDRAAKTLYVAFAAPPKTLDPAVSYTTIDHLVTGNVFDTLLEYDYLARPYTLIPALAEAVPRAEPRDGGRVAYRFTLRPGLLYQDDPCFALGGSGRRTRPIEAADVAFSLMRLADPEVGSPVIDTVAKLDGFREFSAALAARRAGEPTFTALRPDQQYAQVGGLRGVIVHDPRTLEVVLAEAYPQILYWFAMPFTAPLPWEAVAAYDGRDGRDQLADHPVGAGPFRLTRYDRLSRIVLERNPNWYGIRNPDWRAPGAVFPPGADGRLEGRALPFLDRVELRRDPESVPAFFKFMQGYYDTAPIIRESFDRLVERGQLSPQAAAHGMVLDKTVMAAVYYLGFNMDDPVVGAAAGARGRALRQAMSLAIDSAEFLRLFANGRGLPAQSPLPPDLFGYDPNYRNPFRTVDLARAAALLAEVGYANGIDPATGHPLRLTFDVGDTSARAMLQFTFHVEAWKRLGIDVQLDATDYNQFQDKVRRGAYQLFSWGWVADYPDPENFLFLLYGPMGRTRSGGPNTANFSDPRYDELFVRMRALENGPERLALIAAMRDLVQRERPWIELFHPEDYELHHGWLSGVKPAALSLPAVKYYDLDPEARRRMRTEWNQPIRWPAAVVLAVLALCAAPAARRAWRETH
jgi:ABC-type transport system substrate-binding protein